MEYSLLHRKANVLTITKKLGIQEENILPYKSCVSYQLSYPAEGAELNSPQSFVRAKCNKYLNYNSKGRILFLCPRLVLVERNHVPTLKIQKQDLYTVPCTFVNHAILGNWRISSHFHPLQFPRRQ